MGLEKYRAKRRFDKTPEPSGGQSDSDKLIFVVQKHAASHLHYDFRLELKGVLKSWAVPKGPSMNPAQHRLAQEVEDHPLDYKDFEGVIPAGQYGAGTVIIWDQGTYEPAEKIKGRKQQEHWLMSHYYKNTLHIRLHGKKLKGEFSLIRNRERGENAWLLTKIADKYASSEDIGDKDKSVVSPLSIEEMAENSRAKVWQSNRRAVTQEKGIRTDQPAKLEPMLCSLIREPFSNPEWIFEVKFDGYRIIASKRGKNISLRSRKLDFSKTYQQVAEALATIEHDFIIDGEVVVTGENGLPDFDALQRYKGEGELRYYVFDLLWLDGYDLTGIPLEERRNRLGEILPESPILKFSRGFDDGPALFEAVKKQGMEGIIAKRRNSLYQPGKRSANWLKLPAKKIQDFVLGGWTESESGKAFRSLIFGNYRDGRLSYVGHVGLGFKENERREILKALKKLETEKNPFSGKVETETKVHWIKPDLVVTVEFASWTDSGNIRKPATFKGFRKDKDPREVFPEEPLQKAVAEDPWLLPESKDSQPPTAEDSNWPLLEKEEVRSERIFKIEGNDVRISNLEKELWPEVTKAHLLQYYNTVSAYILPQLKDRPLSLYVKHIAATAPGLYIKDMEGRQPPYAEVYSVERKHKKKGKRDMIDYLVCNNLATLWYIINLGCIDLNPWSSRISTPFNPDFISVDLDPTDNDFRKAIKAAVAAREVFDRQKLKAFVKTSGKTGIHLLLPCSGFDFPQARLISERLCREIHALCPDITTTEFSVSKRGTKLYLDPNQNDFADTLACAYSVRPFKQPLVSTPLNWEEINESLNPEEFSIHNIPKRIEKQGDLWSDIHSVKISEANRGPLTNILRA